MVTNRKFENEMFGGPLLSGLTGIKAELDKVRVFSLS
jgi:hypothetical protein